MVHEVERHAAGLAKVISVPHAGGTVHKPEVILQAILQAVDQFGAVLEAFVEGLQAENGDAEHALALEFESQAQRTHAPYDSLNGDAATLPRRRLRGRERHRFRMALPPCGLLQDCRRKRMDACANTALTASPISTWI
jgi:hypothetical protein